MKRLIYFVAFVAFLASCKKSSDATGNNPPPQQKITYKRNGTYKEFTAEEKFTISKNTSPNVFQPYKFMGHLSAAGSSDEYLSVMLLSSTYTQLTVGDYSCQYPIGYATPGGGSIRFPVAIMTLRIYSSPTTFVQKDYTDGTGDFAQVKVAKIENGYASGTFSARMTLENGTEKMNITEGTFTNFKLN